MFRRFNYFTFFLFISLLSCSTNENQKEAYGFERDGKTFIKLKGERRLAAHDPISVVSNKTYEDSLVIQVPSLQNGVVNGNDIPVQQGQYRYIGEVAVREGKIRVSLSYVNTDDKKVEPLSWNGQYPLARN